MSKRARHQPGFYASLLSGVCDRGGSKYRPKVKRLIGPPHALLFVEAELSMH